MEILLGLLAFVAYLAVGLVVVGTLAAWFNYDLSDSQFAGLAVLVWPGWVIMVVVITVLLCFYWLLSRLGWLSDQINRRLW